MRKALANDGDQTLFERAIFSFNFASGDERTEVYFTFHSVIIWDNTGMIAFPRNAVMMMLRMRHSLKPSGWRLNIFLFSPCLAYKCAHSQSTCSGLYLCTKHIFPTLMLKVNVTHSFYLPPSLSLPHSIDGMLLSNRTFFNDEYNIVSFIIIIFWEESFLICPLSASMMPLNTCYLSEAIDIEAFIWMSIGLFNKPGHL